MDRHAFDRATLAHLGAVLAFARRLTRGRREGWEPEDLVQATYARAYDRWRDLEDPGRARAWLFTIARRLHIDRVRSHRARPELRLVRGSDRRAPERCVAPETVERPDRAALEDALDALPGSQREAVLLRDLWGFRYEEIAEMTGVPIGTVRSRIARGRASLVERLGADRTRAGGAS
ncbi:MAG: sigma-70 family RNA polymerase sigma factor [Myxococcota bacterium]